MNKKHFIIPAIIIFIVATLIVFLIPVDIQNTSSFVFAYCAYLLFNIFSILVIEKNMRNIVKEEVHGVSIYYIFGIFNFIILSLWVSTKLIYINTNILVIILLIILLIYTLLLYALVHGKNFINRKEVDKGNHIELIKKWLSKVEIFLNDDKNNKKLKEIYELLRYMDPISIEETQDVDKKIDDVMNTIIKNVDEENLEKVIKLLNERNIILKNYK